MSIVEKSLEKMQLQRRTSEASANQQRSAPAVNPVDLAGNAAAQRPQPLRAPRTPTRTVQVTRELLSAAGLLVNVQEEARLKDEFRRLKWALFNQARQAGPLALPDERGWMITSALSGEGKTFISVHLAMTLAQERDTSVLLVDADVAKRHVSRLFGCEDARGLTDVLRKEDTDVEDYVVGTNVDGLSLLPAGAVHQEAPELLGSARMQFILQQLLEVPNRFVLFDSSPLLLTSESQVLARFMGHVLLVVRAESTPQTDVAEAVRLLGSYRPVGCIVNQVTRSRLTRRLQGYYDHPTEE